MAYLVSSYARAAARAGTMSRTPSRFQQNIQAEKAAAITAQATRHHAAIVQRQTEVARRQQATAQKDMPSPAQIVQAIRDGWFGRYLSVPEPVLDLIVLWALHTHYRTPTPEGGQGHLAFRTTPRLFALSTTPGSGKTTLAEMVGEISANYLGTDQEPTEYGIIDAIADEHATVILDEGDILFGRGARKEGVRSVMQAYTAAATKKTGRNGGTRKTMFGPICLAALDSLATTTGDKLDAMFDRAFCIRMAKAEPPNDPDTRKASDAELARQALKYIADMTFDRVIERAAAEDLPIPAGLQTRARQISRPLFAIAEAIDAASGPDSDWLARAHRAALYFRGTSQATPAQTEELAENFRNIFL